jgi:hypothetical protein
MRSANVVVNDAADEKIYTIRKINKKNHRRAIQQQPPSLFYKNRTDEEMATAILHAKLSKEKHSLAIWKRQKAKERKRRNILRNQAREIRLKNTRMEVENNTDAYAVDRQECDDKFEYEWLQSWLDYYD